MATIQETTVESPPAQSVRLISLDAYRGLAMLLMVSSGLGIAEVAQRFPNSSAWQFAAREVEHVRWRGCSPWDLIMPAFLFIVGVAIPYSIDSRRRRGQSAWRRFVHALWRSVALVLIGVVLLSDGTPRTDFNFINVLAQIGLGYWLVYSLAERSVGVQIVAFTAILIGYWAWFFFYRLPAESFDFAAVGGTADWQRMEGIAAHWELNTNPAAAFDRWFLNLFPRSRPFEFRAGGGTTLNFVPSMATMLLGVLAGRWLKSPRLASQKLVGLVVAGLVLVVGGIVLDPSILPGMETTRWTICPIIKRIWTPSYVLYGGGVVILTFALFYWIVEMLSWRRWSFPLMVVGMNSLVIYMLAALATPFVREALHSIFGATISDWAYGPMLEFVLILLVFWFVCWWLYRLRLFVRI